MLKKFIFPILLSLPVVFQSCNEYEKTESGLEYKLIKDSTGDNAKMGDMVIVHMKFQNEKDTFDTYKRGQPINILLQESFKGSLEEGLTHASKGDSIAIKVSNDSLYTKLFRNDSLPKEIKPGSFTTFNLKVIDVFPKEKLQKDEAERKAKKTEQDMAFMKQMKQQILDSSKAQLKTDEAKISAYVKKNKLNAQKTTNGIYYVVTQEGTGEQPVEGDSVSLHYAGKLLDGKEFDKSQPERPLIFQVGVGAVIPGFDEAVMQLKKGSKATIIIPSPLAYGAQGIKRSETEYVIPQNAPLVFDIELVDVKKRKK
jgi:FKBP-type peptidyl-prolyl cis-trans isomerase FkpA